VLVNQPSLSITRLSEMLVTRLPLAPFVALVAVYSVYAILGIKLTTTAILAVTMGKAVRDAQARLSVDALVAEAFESYALGDDVTKAELLYAERRGMPTSRVALGSNGQGGRYYKKLRMQIIHPRGLNSIY
jgi:hypothetical protein